MIYKTLHRKLKIDGYKPTKTGVSSGAPEGKAVSAPSLPPVVLILLQTNPVISHESMMVNIYFCSAFCAR